MRDMDKILDKIPSDDIQFIKATLPLLHYTLLKNWGKIDCTRYFLRQYNNADVI